MEDQYSQICYLYHRRETWRQCILPRISTIYRLVLFNVDKLKLCEPTLLEDIDTGSPQHLDGIVCHIFISFSLVYGI